MDVFGVGECVIGIEEGGAYEDGCGIVGRAGVVVSAVDGGPEGGVVEGVVLGVASDADVRFGACEVADVVEEVI